MKLRFSRQFFAFGFLVLSQLFLALSVALPWYTIIEEDTPEDPFTSGVSGTIYKIMSWGGVTYHSSFDDDTDFYTRGWGELGLTNAQTVYYVSMCLIILALAISLVTSAVLFFTLIYVSRIGRFLYRILPHKRMSEILILCVLIAWVCVVLAVCLFARLPDTLNENDHSFCPPEEYVGGKGKYWCSSFIGRKTDVGSFETKYGWQPSLGWIFGLLCVFIDLGVMALILVTKAQYDRFGDFGSMVY